MNFVQIWAQSNAPRKITDVPFELPLRICEYLDAPDLVHLCTAIPNSKSILPTRRCSTVMAQHIEQWNWLDRRLCQLLFPFSSQISFQKASEAIQYQAQQTHSCQAILSTLPHDHPTEPYNFVSCHFVTSMRCPIASPYRIWNHHASKLARPFPWAGIL